MNKFQIFRLNFRWAMFKMHYFSNRNAPSTPQSSILMTCSCVIWPINCVFSNSFWRNRTLKSSYDVIVIRSLKNVTKFFHTQRRIKGRRRRNWAEVQGPNRWGTTSKVKNFFKTLVSFTFVAETLKSKHQLALISQCTCP